MLFGILAPCCRHQNKKACGADTPTYLYIWLGSGCLTILLAQRHPN